MRQLSLNLTSGLLASITLAGTLFAGFASASEVNVYSARKEALIKPLLDKFSEETGIEVKLITAKADALLKRMEVEGEASPADLLITVDAGRLQRAKAGNLLQPIESKQLDKRIPANYRDKDNLWYGLSVRARPIFYVRDKVSPGEISSYEELADPKWKGKICIRSSSNIYNQSLVASVLEAKGAGAAGQWLQGLKSNFARPPAGGDTDQLKAAAAGVCELAIANTYYYGRLLNSDDAAKRALAAKLGIIWPNQKSRGTHVNVSGAGVAKHAKNKANAVKLLEYLSSDAAQSWYAQINNEYPVVEGVEISPVLAALGDFKADKLSLNVLGERNLEAVKLMDQAGWR